MMLFRRNRFVAWTAAFAVALQALWPLLSHARPQEHSLLVPVCTIDGITHYLDLKTGKIPLDERTALHGDHCKLCMFGGDRHVALAPRHVVASLVSDSRDSIAVPHPVWISEPANRRPAQPRAPPQAS
jgi:hypothetical protein